MAFLRGAPGAPLGVALSEPYLFVCYNGDLPMFAVRESALKGYGKERFGEGQDYKSTEHKRRQKKRVQRKAKEEIKREAKK